MASSFYNDSLNIRDNSQQKRKKARTSASLNGEFVITGQTQPHECVVTDVGTGGLSILTKSTLYDGDKVTVRLRIAGKLMAIDTNVVRVSGKNVGLQFSNMTDEEMSLIQDYIHENFFSKDKKKT